MENIILYNRVNERGENYNISFKDAFVDVDNLMMKMNFDSNVIFKVKRIISKSETKEQKWSAKKDNLMAFSLEKTNYFIIDIDTFNNKSESEKVGVLNLLKQDEDLVMIKESISANIFLLYETNERLNDFDFHNVYNTKFIDVLNKVKDNVDYLPERNRLRYLTNDKVLFLNDNHKKIDSWINFTYKFNVNNIIEKGVDKKTNAFGSRF